MTTPPAVQPVPTQFPLNPPDLYAARDANARQFRVAKIAAIAVLLGFGCLIGLAAAIGIGGWPGVLVGVACVLAFGLPIVIPMWLHSGKEAKAGPLASPGPSSIGRVVTSAPGEDVWRAVYAALAAEKFGRPVPSDPQTVVASRSLSMWSYGESITVRLEATTDGRGLVTAWSRPAYPLQWVDYGRNRRFVNAVLRAVPGATPVE